MCRAGEPGTVDERDTASTGPPVPSDLFKVSVVGVAVISEVKGAVAKASIGDNDCAVVIARE